MIFAVVAAVSLSEQESFSANECCPILKWNKQEESHFLPALFIRLKCGQKKKDSLRDPINIPNQEKAEIYIYHT